MSPLKHQKLIWKFVIWQKNNVSTCKIASMTSEEQGWAFIIAATASTAVDLEDQNLTAWRTCRTRTATTDCGTAEKASALTSCLFGESNSGLTSVDISDFDPDTGVTSADVHDLRDDPLVCIVIGTGGSLELASSVFGIWPDAADATEFRLHPAVLAR